ncbi:aminoacylase-1 isoform X2 [Strongylocentrotus purpuratus]|uniref:N-acyl-aliphatic-L-amino acid amidohydrolase n=1 Tax=Strongylocentrotus purpuratus TaxID=7668 RepID=A0A7M7TG90_STRPU|nr:aminoacylase-1 isoform X2 [Strongylocentrotus purpuratus]
MAAAAKRSKMQENQAVTNFREYLRFKTVEPNPDYAGANAFLKRMGDELGLPVRLIEVHPGKIVVVITWEGTHPHLKSIVLNSHIDVVPVFPEHWDSDPFEAKKKENGDIVARGSQDMKCVGIQYIEAVRRLMKAGKRLMRTIHMTFVPDEEIGGNLGMGEFTKTQEFKDLNVGFGLDEGLANPTEQFSLYHGERATWRVEVTCVGRPGHGSQFIQDTAAVKLQKVLTAFLKYRDQEEARAKKSGVTVLGDVNTVNLVKLSGGVANNVVPSDLTVLFDLRVSPYTTPEDMVKKLDELVASGGPGVTYKLPRKGVSYTTPLGDDNTWWQTFKKACAKEKAELQVVIFPAGTDSRYIRALGIPCLGFSPMNNTPILLHDHNEYLNEDVFLRGISIYETIITEIANVPEA